MDEAGFQQALAAGDIYSIQHENRELFGVCKLSYSKQQGKTSKSAIMSKKETYAPSNSLLEDVYEKLGFNFSGDISSASASGASGSGRRPQLAIADAPRRGEFTEGTWKTGSTMTAQATAALTKLQKDLLKYLNAVPANDSLYRQIKGPLTV